MLGSLARTLFGSANERKVKPLMGAVPKINALEPRFQPMSDEELKAMTPAFKEEHDEPSLIALPRLAFHFNRRNLGRLRQLIDCINRGRVDD